MKIDLKTVIKLERIKTGLTQSEVANYLGIEISGYAKYERGLNVPPIEKILKLSELYNVSTDYLLGKEDISAYFKKSWNMGEELGEKTAENIIKFLNKRRKRKNNLNEVEI